MKVKNSFPSILILIFCLFIFSNITAQKWVNPNFETHRLDYRDLGYEEATEIAGDNAPISALLSHSNGKVYGATSGYQSYLFVYDYLTNKVYPLGQIPGAKGVHHCLAEGKDGLIYIGTGLNELTLINLSSEMPHGRRAIEIQLWNDIKNKYKDFEGGHIFVYDPKEGDNEVYLPESIAKVKDMGIAVEKNSIYTMAINNEKTKIYGISYPDAVFFEYDIIENKFKNHGQWLQNKSYSGPERSWRSVPRSLICMPDGRVYSSADHGLMFYFDPSDEKFHETSIRIPGEYWQQQNYDGYPVIEQLIPNEYGKEYEIFGSTNDGFIFKVDLESKKMKVMGKPRIERRVRAMTLGKDQRLYMICGEKENICQMISYDLSEKDEGFIDYGILGVDRSPYYQRMGHQFDAMCTAKDGTIFIGESDYRAKLFFYVPGGSVVEGRLNPTNPRGRYY